MDSGKTKLYVSDVRYPIVDQAYGIVLAIGLMHVDRGEDADATQRNALKGVHSLDSPHLRQTPIEFFEIQDGTIQQIQETMLDLNDPDVKTTGWLVDTLHQIESHRQ